MVGTTGGIASGPVSFMRIWDSMCGTLLSTGARRGAMMATLRCDHPDIEQFIDAKRDAGIGCERSARPPTQALREAEHHIGTRREIERQARRDEGEQGFGILPAPPRERRRRWIRRQRCWQLHATSWANASR